jgi:hypothetical protein
MTFVLSAHMTKIKDPAIRPPNPKATHPNVPGASTVAKTSAVSGVVLVITGIAKATQTPVDESHACVEDCAFSRSAQDQHLIKI